MRLLVSVRNAEEARAAWEGGAGVVDAKDPASGALGAVARTVLRQIRAALPVSVPVSAALGDVSTPAEVRAALVDLPDGLAFLKLGFRGVNVAGTIERLLRLAVTLVAEFPGAPRVIAAAYADWSVAGGAPPATFPPLIAAAGAHGLLVDTASKNGRTLLDHLPAQDLMRLGAELRVRGLDYALGGSLTARDLPAVRAAGAGFLGVRGAVTTGRRSDSIDPARVAALAEAVRATSEASLR